MDENFGEEYHEIKNKALLDANQYFFNHIDELELSFRNSLNSACEHLKGLQKKGYQPVEYLEFTLLRTRLLKHDYKAPVMVYGSDWYADTCQTEIGTVNLEPIYSFFEEMIRKTVTLVKKYQTKLEERCLELCMCETAECFWNYVSMACQRAAMGFSPQELNITEEFRIRCCEYMGYGSVLWRYTPEMSLEQLKKWFDKKEADTYRFRDYRGKNFSGWDFSGMDLTACDFRGCNLEECIFDSADLTGTWFCESNLQNASFDRAWMPGARFDKADLRGAVLVGAYSTSKINGDLWMRPDNIRASFLEADLRNADFNFSAIECADFTDAAMGGTLFHESHKDYYDLDEAQKALVQYGDFEDEE